MDLKDRIKIVRFVTSGDDFDHTSDTDDTPDGATAEFVSSATQYSAKAAPKTYYKEHAWPKVKLEWIKAHKDHAFDLGLANDCKTWESLRNKAAHDRGNKLNRTERQQFRDLDVTLGARCLGGVSIVVGTFNSFGSQQMVGFKPEVGIIDEAAQAPAFEIAVFFAAFANSLLSISLWDDHMQFGPLISSRGTQNPAAVMACVTIFETHWKAAINGNGLANAYVLNVQHRCDPEIAAIWKAFCYGNCNIEDDDSTRTVCATTQAYLDRFRSLLGSRYKDNRVILVDVTAPFAHSKYYEGTLSICNEAEAKVLHWVVQSVLKGVPEDQRGAVQVITGYRGQQKLLSDVEAEQIRNCTETYPRGSVRSINQAQGSGYLIQFSSLVTNNPVDTFNVGFMNERARLNVMFSRPKKFHVVVGAFKQWFQPAYLQGLKQKRISKEFGRMMEILKTSGCPVFSPEDFDCDGSWKHVDVSLLHALGRDVSSGYEYGSFKSEEEDMDVDTDEGGVALG